MKVLARSLVLVLAVGAGAPVLGQWSSVALSQCRGLVAATTVGNKALIAGGFGQLFSHKFSLDTVDIYDDTTGAWSTATLSMPRNRVAATTVGTKAMFAGGNNSSTFNSFSTDVVDIYDDATGMWTVDTLPTVRGPAVATTVGTKAMFTNGTSVDIYDDSTGTWATMVLGHTPTHVWLAATTVGTKAMFAGGGDNADVVDIYDDSLGLPPDNPAAWSTATLSQGRGAPTATTVGTKAIFAGGILGGSSLQDFDAVDIYDDATGTWSVATLSQARWDIAATTVGTKAMFVGGQVLTGPATAAYTDVVDIYDDASGTWTTATLPVAQGGMAATTVGSKAVFAGLSLYGCPPAHIYDDAIGTIYCSPAVANSTGQSATIAAQGFPGAVAQGYALLTASRLPQNQFGYFLNSETQASMFPVPNSQGVLCLGGAIGRYRTNVFSTGAAGTGFLQLDLPNTPTPSGTVAIQAGETWNFTAWYRDLNPNTTSNFTDGVSIVFQ